MWIVVHSHDGMINSTPYILLNNLLLNTWQMAITTDCLINHIHFHSNYLTDVQFIVAAPTSEMYQKQHHFRYYHQPIELYSIKHIHY